MFSFVYDLEVVDVEGFDLETFEGQSLLSLVTR